MSRRLQVIPRENAPTLIFAFAASCAVTVAGTRAYLDLTGYPSIGGAVYHIAHALWGGLALTLSTILLLALSNRWVPLTGALLGGVGAGLFVDEVGKFITRKNDYFFPLAASIVYLFLVLLALGVLALRAYQRDTPSAHLHAAFDIAERVADAPLSGPASSRLRAHLDGVDQGSPTPEQAIAAEALRRLVPARTGLMELDPEQTRAWRLVERVGALRMRRITRVLLWFHGLVGVLLLLSLPLSLAPDSELIPSEIAQFKVGSLASGLAMASFLVAGLAGLGCLIASRAMSPKHLDIRRAQRVGYGSLGALLVIGNSLGAYTSQFGILFDAMIQALTLATLALWVRLVT